MLWSRPFYLIALVFILSPHIAFGFSFRQIPSPTSYERGAVLDITVNSLTSRKGLLPYDFYSIPSCRPDDQTMREGRVKENLGEILLGNRIMPSVYHVEVGMDVSCRMACSIQYIQKEMRRVKKLINQYYRAHMFLEGLPVVEKQSVDIFNRKLRLGYRLGIPQMFDVSSKTYLHNHLNFTIMYSSTGLDMYSISGFYVTPVSSEKMCLEDPQHDLIEAEGSKNVTFSYSVTWVEDTEPGVITTRWDVYARALRSAARKGHWMAIINSILLLCFLGLLVGLVLVRTLRRDLLMYADPEFADDDVEERGWKLVRRDVFRAPSHPLILSGIVGTGSQAIMMFFVTIIAAFMGVLHPSQRGNLLTGLVVFFCLGSGVSGYVAGRMLKFFHKQSWKNGFASIMLVPGFLIACYFTANFINWYKHASTAIPFGTLILLFLLWVTIFVPLGLLGLSIGFRVQVLEPPCKPGSIPRTIPVESQKRRNFYILGGGVILFTAAFVEIVYVLGAFWKGEPFHYFGYLAGIIIIVSLVCGEVAVVVTYALLTEEDYHWWWGSLCSSGSCGLFFYIYSFVYLWTSLEVRQPLSIILYLIYMCGISTLISVLTGTIGFLSSAAFVYAIYGAVKAD